MKNMSICKTTNEFSFVSLLDF
ncbi:hypothetical protein ML437_12630 [Staphylococcus roterodami]|nr:hypothetical protein ML435_12590 [Staphylococcus roterodami]UMT81922.1 hypothetical protein ML437_12630 [Staphylococcus roterodami]